MAQYGLTPAQRTFLHPDKLRAIRAALVDSQKKPRRANAARGPKPSELVRPHEPLWDLSARRDRGYLHRVMRFGADR